MGGSPSHWFGRKVQEEEDDKSAKRKKKKTSERAERLEKRREELEALEAKSGSSWPKQTEILVEKHPAIRREIRSSMYGGRVYPNQMRFESPDFARLQKLMGERKREEECAQPESKSDHGSKAGALLRDAYGAMGENYLVGLDVNSLYPAAMTYDLPYGRRLGWERATSASPEPPRDKMGIYLIRYTPNPELMTPVLPYHSESGALKWDLLPREGWYNSVDIASALRHGYRIEYVRGHYWEKKGPIFRRYMEYMYAEKATAKASKGTPQFQASVYAGLKLLLNGFYGKLGQRPVLLEYILSRDQAEMLRFMETHHITFFEEHEGGLWTWRGNKKDELGATTKPAHLGSFVLGWSRAVMLETMDALDPGLRTLSWVYGDTDSIFVIVNRENRAAVQALMGDGLGELSNDVAGSTGKNGKVVRLVSNGPKSYAYTAILDDGSVLEVAKLKGCHKDILQHKRQAVSDMMDGVLQQRFEKEKGGVKREREAGVDQSAREIRWGTGVDARNTNALTSSKPYMVRKLLTGQHGRDIFSIRQGEMVRTYGKTEYQGRCFAGADTMSVPWGHTLLKK